MARGGEGMLEAGASSTVEAFLTGSSLALSE